MKKLVYCCGTEGIRGKIDAPASKSALQRLIALSWLSHGTTVIKNPYYCDDVNSSLGIVSALGASVEKGESFISIDSTDNLLNSVNRGERNIGNMTLDCGESGLAIRMFSPVVSLSEKRFTLEASGSLTGRPSSIITETLKSFGVEASDAGGFPPVTIRGPLRGGKGEIDGSVSSQILTGLLLALPAASGDSEITVKNLKSRPYIDMTIELASLFGCSIENHGYEVFSIRGGQSYASPGTVTAEGDWSSASFLIAAAILCRSEGVRIENLRPDSSQADRAILDIAEICGATIEKGRNHIVVSFRGSVPGPFEFDASDCPDLFPPLAALASGCGGVSRIHGVGRLRHKESDREMALVEELSKGGIDIGSDGKTMTVKGPFRAKSFTGSSHNDHRIAMALAVAALAGSGRVEIENAGAVSKSYPGFFDDLKKLGGRIE